MAHENEARASGYQRRNVYSIPAGEPFLPIVAQALCDGRLVPGFALNDDPLTLTRATIYVPTRRAARELRSAFIDVLNSGAALLPSIVPLGEFDEEAAFFNAGDPTGTVQIPPAIGDLERQVLLGSWVARWAENLKPELKTLLGDDPETPVSTADAFWMARDLGTLLDQMQTENISFADLEKATEADISDWWRLTHTFLAIVREHWPNVLSALGKVDPATRRNMLLDAERKRIEKADPHAPFIVAGSTGTIPATAALIKAVAMRSSGAVVLPGYQYDMSADVAQQLLEPADIASAIGHPQFGMQMLVREMGVQASGLVEPLTAGDIGASTAKRRWWVDMALAPSPLTDEWAIAAQSFNDEVFNGVAILHAKSANEEALAIASALREALIDPTKTCALVTPDRGLASQVSAELKRFDIVADDSGGTPFANTLHGQLLSLALQLAVDGSDPNTLAALLKHPFVNFGLSNEEREQAFLAFELFVLRGPQRRFAVSDLSGIATQNITYFQSDKVQSRLPASYPVLNDAAAEKIEHLCTRIAEIFGAFCSGDVEGLPVSELGARTVKLLEAIASDEAGIKKELYASDAGQLLASTLSTISEPGLDTLVEPAQWPSVVRALTMGAVVKPDYGGHPRLSIWGTLEARLQTVDFLIMGGLNEGQWPSVPTNDPFVTRGMKSAMGMDPPERRIGLAAHDFQMGMGASQILITRATKRDGAPTVASRWVQRLETLAGEHARETMRARGQGFAELAAAVVSKARIKPLDPPTPKPPLVARPKRLSVTEVETLRRDPYAIYAKHTLRLRKLDPIMQEPDARTRGTLIHDCAEAIVKAQLDYASEEAVHRMIEIARAKFDEAGLPPDIDVIWWARMNAIIPELLYWERGRDAHIAKRFAELSAKAVELDDTGVVLGGRGDRFDLRADGRVDILDIKTGSHPSPKQVQKQFAPQLPLEAAMLERGAFRDISNTTPGDLIYVKLGSRGEVQPKVVGPWDVDEASKKKDLELTSTELAARDWNALVKLVKYYQDETKPYLSYPVPEKNRRWAGDYDHLARVAEWAGEDTHGEGGEDFS